MKTTFAAVLIISLIANCQNNKIMQIDQFKVIGIQMETTNENNQSAEDLGRLWGKFYGEDISNKIPNKSGTEIYSIYTDYESDYQGRYLVIIGQKVSSLENIPEGMVGREIGGGNYHKIVAKGEMPQAVVDAWLEIWDNDVQLNRAYTSDFEVYSEKSSAGRDSEVEIYLATK